MIDIVKITMEVCGAEEYGFVCLSVRFVITEKNTALSLKGTMWDLCTKINTLDLHYTSS